MYAEVVVSLDVEGTFHYHIPAEFAGRLETGHLVEIPFGRQKAQGVVVAIDREAPVQNTKPILRLVDRQPVLNDTQLLFARWLSEYYLTPLSNSVRLFIPPTLARRGDILYTPVIDPSVIEPATDNQARLLKLFETRGALRGRQIARALSRRNWSRAALQLVERGLLLREAVLDQPIVEGKKIRLVELGIPPDQLSMVGNDDSADAISSPNRRVSSTVRREMILRHLARESRPIEVGEIYAAVPGSKLADVKALREDDLIVIREAEIWRDPLHSRMFIPDRPPALTPDQLQAWEKVRASLDVAGSAKPVLLHGVTGSGKTEIYIRAVDHILKQGRTSVVLVPEIALTAQTIQRFGARFPGRMGLVHSALSDGERYDTWRRIRSGKISLVIGTRSALFVPLANLGLLVIDEAHDDSLKQSPPLSPPYYHAVPAAIRLAHLHQGLALLGSATPDITTYANSLKQDGPIQLVTLPGRIMGHRRAIELQTIHYHIDRSHYVQADGNLDEAVMTDLPPVQIVDMRQELRDGNHSIFSRALHNELEQTLRRGEQTILFLNRRGSASYVFCRSCGHVMKCPRCDNPLTWHTTQGVGSGKQGMLVCHHCNYRAKHPDVCPNCGSQQIRFLGGGTEKVEQEVTERFPDAIPLRWDKDTAATTDAHFAILSQFSSRQANVLIGTQMIAKGIDLPLVTLVGVVSADIALHLPDYRSPERTFQVLTQVAGRAGRGILGGKAIIQTYSPDHYSVVMASNHDYEGFYAAEIRHRQALGYPPFLRLARLIIRGETASQAQRESERIFDLVKSRLANEGGEDISMIGPAPCFYPRRDNLFRWHIILKGRNPISAISELRQTRFLQIDIDPVSLL